MVLCIVEIIRTKMLDINTAVDIALEGKYRLPGIFGCKGRLERLVATNIQRGDITADIHECLQVGSRYFPELPDQQLGILYVSRPGIFLRQPGRFEILTLGRG